MAIGSDHPFVVRPSTAADVPLLEAAMPSRGLDVHAHHYGAAQTGDTVHLVVWAGEEPVGTGVIRWAGYRFPMDDPSLPTHPELSNLGVAPAWQRRGAGTALIEAAGACIRERGYPGVSIGVGIDNPAARRLYLRLGFVETDVLETTTYAYPDVNGVLQQITETDRLLRRDF